MKKIQSLNHWERRGGDGSMSTQYTANNSVHLKTATGDCGGGEGWTTDDKSKYSKIKWIILTPLSDIKHCLQSLSLLLLSRTHKQKNKIRCIDKLTRAGLVGAWCTVCSFTRTRHASIQRHRIIAVPFPGLCSIPAGYSATCPDAPFWPFTVWSCSMHDYLKQNMCYSWLKKTFCLVDYLSVSVHVYFVIDESALFPLVFLISIFIFFISPTTPPSSSLLLLDKLLEMLWDCQLCDLKKSSNKFLTFILDK